MHVQRGNPGTHRGGGTVILCTFVPELLHDITQQGQVLVTVNIHTLHDDEPLNLSVPKPSFTLAEM